MSNQPEGRPERRSDDGRGYEPRSRGGWSNDRGGNRRDERDDRPRRDDRPSYRDRDDRGGDRGGFRRDDRPQGGGFRRDDRPSGGFNRGGFRRDDRPGGFRRDERDDRPRRDERPSYRDRDDRGGDRGGFRRDDRPSGDRGGFRRDDRPQGGFNRDRDDRGGFRRDDRPSGDRGGFRRDDRGGDRGGFRRDDRQGGFRGGDRRDDRGGDRDRRDYDDRRGNYEPVKRLPIPEDVTGFELDADVRQELKSLPKTLADDVARNLVMVARLLDGEPEEAYQYSRVALRLASRVAAVREAAGFASYMTQRYSEALTEFRAARRMTGRADLWPVMADCERGLGRPERALAMAGEPEVKQLDKAGQVEMRLVAAGARSDMEQFDAAVVTLQSPELASSAVHPWTARLRYAYAEALIAAGRGDEARDWFAKAAEADTDGSTNASERLAEIDGVEFTDALDPELDEDDAEQADAPAAKKRGGDNADDRVIFEDEEDVEEYYDEDDLEIDEDFDGVVPERAEDAKADEAGEAEKADKDEAKGDAQA